MSTTNLLSATPKEFISFLKNNKINRFYFVYDSTTGKLKASHKELEPAADFFNNDRRDYRKHEGIFVQLSSEYDTLFAAFVHRTNRGQAAGGLRYWQYNTMEDFFRDGLRLAMGMTHKNALAGLWWGGGKGLMAYNPAIDKQDAAIREYLYKEYGKFITSLNGCYVTAEDVGTTVDDMANIFTRTRFTTCIPPELGGSGNPSVPTARGIVAGIVAAFEFLGEKIEGKTIAVQGLGNVGLSLIKFLFEKNVKKVIGWDIFPEVVDKAKDELQNNNTVLHLCKKDDISMFGVECDLLSPNATGAILNPATIPLIKAKIVCGAANNQLEDPIRDDISLHQRGIIYVPDFLTNRMGIVNCADEQAGYVNNDPLIERHLNKEWEYSIHQMTLKVLSNAKETGVSTGSAAVDMAEKLSLEDNPIFGHRSKLIIDSLVDNKWHLK